MKLKMKYPLSATLVAVRLPAITTTSQHLILNNSTTSPIPQRDYRAAGVSN